MTKKYVTIFSLLCQLSFTFIVLFVIYIIFALLDADEVEIVSGIGFLIFQPLWGIILISFTIGLCFIIGLPIRFLPKLKLWWVFRPVIPLLCVFAGIILLAVSLVPSLMETTSVVINGQNTMKRIPNTFLFFSGWFMTAFFLLHFYPISLIILFRRRK